MSTETKVVFIIGAQRGGTTVLGRVLGQLEGFVFAGEVRNLWRAVEERCTCGSRVCDCPLWSPVLAAVLKERSAAQVAEWQDRHLPSRHSWMSAIRLAWRRQRPLPSGSDLARYGSVLTDLYAQIAAVSDADVVVDASKHPNDALLLTRLHGVAPYFVQIVRDPRGSAYSAQRRKERRAVRTPELSPPSTSSRTREAARVTVNWTTRHLAGEGIRRLVGADRSMMLSYEDFVARPEAALAQVAQLVGDRPRQLPEFRGRSIALPDAHGPGSSKKLREGNLTLRHDDRWLSDFGIAEARVTTALGWPLMRRYGYPLRRPRRDASASG